MTKLEIYKALLKVGGIKKAIFTTNYNYQIPTKQRKLIEYKSTVDKQNKYK
jgi:hypothetical protein